MPPRPITPPQGYQRHQQPSLQCPPRQFPDALVQRLHEPVTLQYQSNQGISLEDQFPFLKDGRKRTRKLLTPEQTRVLEAVLEKTAYPSTPLRNAVARQLDVSPRKVQVWFQNKRQGHRRHTVTHNGQVTYRDQLGHIVGIERGSSGTAHQSSRINPVVRFHQSAHHAHEEDTGKAVNRQESRLQSYPRLSPLTKTSAATVPDPSSALDSQHFLPYGQGKQTMEERDRLHQQRSAPAGLSIFRSKHANVVEGDMRSQTLPQILPFPKPASGRGPTSSTSSYFEPIHRKEPSLTSISSPISTMNSTAGDQINSISFQGSRSPVLPRLSELRLSSGKGGSLEKIAHDVRGQEDRDIVQCAEPVEEVQFQDKRVKEVDEDQEAALLDSDDDDESMTLELPPIDTFRGQDVDSFSLSSSSSTTSTTCSTLSNSPVRTLTPLKGSATVRGILPSISELIQK